MDYARSFLKMLEKDGLYYPEDIRRMIDDGEMQSFVENSSWAITRVLDFPRMRVLECCYVVGLRSDLNGLQSQMEIFARDNGCRQIRAIGRSGWSRLCEGFDWKLRSARFTKEL